MNCKWITDILRIIYPKDEHEAKNFLQAAEIERNKIIRKNTDKIIHELRKDMDHAIHAGRTHIHYWQTDYTEYDDLYNEEEIFAWLRKWSKYDGFKLEYQDWPEGYKHYKLSWELR